MLPTTSAVAVHTPIGRFGAVTSNAAAVVMRDRQVVEVDALDAAHVDRGHLLALRIHAEGERMHAAVGAETMFDAMLVEQIAFLVRLRREPRELIQRREPQQ